MKTMKKIFALTLAMMMVFSLALSANAANPVTIENAQDGATYKIYKMLNVKSQVSDENGIAIVYEIAAGWEEFFQQDNVKTYFDVKADNVVVATDAFNDAAAAAVAALAATYATENNLTFTTPIVNNDSVTASLDDGYYLMTSTLGAKKSTLVNINGSSLTIREKNTEDDLPKIEKKVEALGADYKVGDIGNFTITVVCEEGKDTYTVHDLMQGLSVEGTISVRVPEGATATVNNPSTVCTKDCSFEVVVNFGDAKSKAYDEIVITYQAKVLESGVESFSNKAWVENVTDTVDETTTKFTLKKTDGENLLSGAEFELYVDKNEEKIKVPVVAIKDENNNILYYRPAGDNETGVQIVAGEVTIKGLEEGVVYYVKETKAPDGYIPIDGYQQVISDEVKVVNVLGEELPETGGMGTTVLYVMGGLMVAGAVVLLITKKRMSAM